MGFYFCGDGASDVACSFEEDGEARWALYARTQFSACFTEDIRSTRPNIHAGIELLQPYAQQWVLEQEPQMFAQYQRLFALAAGEGQTSQDQALDLTVYRGPNWAAFYKGTLSDPQLYLGTGVLH
jgi:hypothetical protein